MTATDFIETGRPIPRLASIRVTGPGSLEVHWAEGDRAGSVDLVDLAPVIGSYKVYRSLRDDSDRFATARLVEDGYAVAWSGVEVEMTSELIAECAEETMDGSEFARFLKRNRLTQEAAAALLGRSRRQIAYYLKGGPIPRVVALACFGYEALNEKRRVDAA